MTCLIESLNQGINKLPQFVYYSIFIYHVEKITFLRKTSNLIFKLNALAILINPNSNKKADLMQFTGAWII